MAQESKLTKFKDGAAFILLILGTVFGIYKFIWQDMIVPARRPPVVTLDARLDELDRLNGMILVRAHLVVANHGDAKVWVPAFWWNVYGISFSGENRLADEFPNYASPLLESGEESVPRFSSFKRVEIAAVGRIPDLECWYQPKDETVFEELFLVPDGEFEALRIDVNAYVTKSIDKFAPTRWEITEQDELIKGVLMPTLLLKMPGWDQDHLDLVEKFDPGANRKHKKMSDRADAGYNSTTASLRLKPMESTATATTKNGNTKR
jgi:hypothetical protein